MADSRGSVIGASDDIDSGVLDWLVERLVSDASGEEDEEVDDYSDMEQPEVFEDLVYTECPFINCYRRRLCTLTTTYWECGSFRACWTARSHDEYQTPLGVEG